MASTGAGPFRSSPGHRRGVRGVDDRRPEVIAIRGTDAEGCPCGGADFGFRLRFCAFTAPAPSTPISHPPLPRSSFANARGQSTLRVVRLPETRSWWKRAAGSESSSPSRSSHTERNPPSPTSGLDDATSARLPDPFAPPKPLRWRPSGISTSASSEQVIGLDGMAVIVNPSNPIGSLSKEQIEGIFSGTLRRWSELGGPDTPIAVLAREDDSDTVDAFDHAMLGGKTLAATAERYDSSEALSDAVAAARDAIGLVELPNVRSAKPVLVSDRYLASRLPSPMTVATEEYALARRLYFYIPASAPRAASEFVDFALSEDGQDTVAAAGFVDLRPRCDATASRCPKCLAEYRDLVHGACRVSIDFRFEHGDIQFDSRALRDVQRLTTWLSQPLYSARRLVLLGFSDTQGRRGDNIIISELRAEFVANQLRARGVPIAAVRGFGPDMLVTDDSTEEGQRRNRRVEVWLR